MNENGVSFDNLTNVGKPLNSQNDDFAMTFNQDGKSGFFSSNRSDGKGDDDIYSFNMVKPFIFKVKLVVSVADNKTGSSLPGSIVYLKDQAGKVLQKAIVDEKGQYTFELEPNKEYVISASKDDYKENLANLTTKNLTTSSIQAQVNLDKNEGFSLYGLITDNKTKQALSEVKVTIVDKSSGKVVFDGITANSGDFDKVLENVQMNQTLNYSLTLKKDGYLTKTADFSKLVTTPGVINMNEKLDVSLTKVEVGLDLAELIDIKPIYFDRNKFTIRSDASIELDKIVKVMNEYPTMVIELGSHTDCRGTILQNATLSDNRAKASAEYIKKKITNPDRIYGKGFGESKLKSDCPCEGSVKSTCTEEQHQENRRTEFLIIKI
jgi:outer membrane protein OmpA-like peptidoglycan-associated protein